MRSSNWTGPGLTLAWMFAVLLLVACDGPVSAFGTVRSALGDAQVNGAAAEAGTAINQGAVLRTGDSSTMEFSSEDVQSCRSFDETELTVRPTPEIAVRWSGGTGETTCLARKQGTFQVLPNTTIEIQATVFTVDLTADGVDVRALEGAVAVTAGGVRVIVAAGEVASVRGNDPPTVGVILRLTASEEQFLEEHGVPRPGAVAPAAGTQPLVSPSDFSPVLLESAETHSQGEWILRLRPGLRSPDGSAINALPLKERLVAVFGTRAEIDPLDDLSVILFVQGIDDAAFLRELSQVTFEVSPAAPGGGDVKAPRLHLPVDTVVEATSPTGARYEYAVTATDDGDSSPAVRCDPPPGLLPLGVTTIECTATDSAGNSTVAAWPVSVVDTTAPVLALNSDVTIAATSNTGAIYRFSVSAVDAVDPAPNVTCTPPTGSHFAIGNTSVDCTATDLSGNTATSSFTVTVTDAARAGSAPTPTPTPTPTPQPTPPPLDSACPDAGNGSPPAAQGGSVSVTTSKAVFRFPTQPVACWRWYQGRAGELGPYWLARLPLSETSDVGFTIFEPPGGRPTASGTLDALLAAGQVNAWSGTLWGSEFVQGVDVIAFADAGAVVITLNDPALVAELRASRPSTIELRFRRFSDGAEMSEFAPAAYP